MKKRFVIGLSALLVSIGMQAQTPYVTTLTSQEGEYWWGGITAYGSRMPYIKPIGEFDLLTSNSGNQAVPLLVSSKGRYVWSDYPFRFTASKEGVVVRSDFEKVDVGTGGTTLRDAYLAACRKHFPPTGAMPEPLFFSVPQYNTWIELMYNQNQKDILNYARSIVANDMPGGVIMIDDNWQKYYGNLEFKPDKFPNPKEMTAELHRLGFKVMLWICPFVSADSQEYRELRDKGFLIKEKGGGTALFSWWNGYSACYDFTNPAAVAYFVAALKGVQQEYGIDGFKFDAGDCGFYARKDLVCYKKDALPTDHSKAWAEIGLQFPFNEYRACWQMGGAPLIQRLGDKDYSWNALQLLIPDMIAVGLLGYAYACPDMIGGGQYTTFLGIDQSKIDQRLIVRSAQVHALMPMMQFSVAPWRILNKENMAIVRRMARLHASMGGYIVECMHHSAQSGEPIVRHLEYAFPSEGFAECKDQFMLGDRYLVAPVLTKGDTRTVKLPRGRWKDDLGKVHRGGKTITVNAPIDRLPYFEKLK